MVGSVDIWEIFFGPNMTNNCHRQHPAIFWVLWMRQGGSVVACICLWTVEEGRQATKQFWVTFSSFVSESQGSFDLSAIEEVYWATILAIREQLCYLEVWGALWKWVMIGGYCSSDEGPHTREILLSMYTRIAERGGIFPCKGKEKKIFIHLFGKREFVKRGREDGNWKIYGESIKTAFSSPTE